MITMVLTSNNLNNGNYLLSETIDALDEVIDKIDYPYPYCGDYDFFWKLFPDTEDLHGECMVELVDPATIARFNDDSSSAEFKEAEVLEAINDVEVKGKEILGYPNDPKLEGIVIEIFSELKGLKEVLFKATCKDIKNIVKSLLEYIQKINDRKKYIQDATLNLKLQEFLDLLNRLIQLLKLLKFKLTLLGYYCGGRKEKIYICPENIEKVIDESPNLQHNTDYKGLVTSVLIHEYTHCIHYHFCKNVRKSKNYKKQVLKSAMLETVAETVQYIYIRQLNQNSLENWIVEHSQSGLFPGWGYAGEEVLRELCSSFDKNNYKSKVFLPNLKDYQEWCLLKEIIEVSRYDWLGAYILIVDIIRINNAS